ncbi:MAG: peptidyl-prolyl cis-trans isomerase [Pseudomonadota bacterium]
MREGTKSWVAGAFIFLIAASFAVWGIGDWIGGALQKDVATIGDKTITQVDFRRLYDREMRVMQQRFGRVIQRDEARLRGVDQRTLATLLGTAAIELHSDELNLGVSDGAVAERIKRDPAFQSIGGGFDRDRYDQTLRFSGVNEAAFIEQQRRGLIRRQLTETITSGVKVPETLTTALNAYRNEERDAEYIVLTDKQIEAPGEPTDAQMKTYYEENPRRFTAPEYRKLKAIVLRPADFADRVEVNEADVRESYESRSREFNTPEQRTVEQITFPDKAAAEKAAEELKGGKTFGALADEVGREDRFISHGSITKTGLLDPSIANAAFALGEPGITDPVEGDLSTSLVRVTKIDPATSKSFDEVKEQVERELRDERTRNFVANLFDEIEDDRAKGLAIEDIASKREATLTEIAAVDQNGQDPEGKPVTGFPANVSLRRAVFAAEIDLQADAVELGNDSFAVFELDEVIPAKVRPLETVKDDVKSAWIAEQKRNALTSTAAAIVEDLNKGRPLADIAKEKGVEVKTAADLRRSARTDDLPSGAIGRLFTLGKGAAATAELLGGQQRVVFRVTDTEVPEKTDGQVQTQIENLVADQLGEEMVAEYLQALQSRYDVEVDQEAIEQATSAAGPTGARGGF